MHPNEKEILQKANLLVGDDVSNDNEAEPVRPPSLLEFTTALEAAAKSRSTKPKARLAATVLKSLLTDERLKTDEITFPEVVEILVEAAPQSSPPEHFRARLRQAAIDFGAIDELDALLSSSLTKKASRQTLGGDLKLARDDKGRPLPVGHNIETVLRKASGLGGRFRWDIIRKQIVIEGADDLSLAGPNDQHVAVANLLGRRFGMHVASHHAGEQLLYVARTFGPYNPIAEYLDSLTWDGVERIDSWLASYCGAADSAYVREVGAMFLMAAAARGLNPGSKVDTVLTLLGRQSARKSTALSILGGEFFSDTPLQLTNKDAYAVASNRWIVELAELASFAEAETKFDQYKAFLSSRTDDYRPPYGKAIESFDRCCVFAGTVNPDGNGNLVDPTGNRRYWNVVVGDLIDVAALRRDRDLLWAEAVARYREGLAHADGDERPLRLRWWYSQAEQTAADDVNRSFTRETQLTEDVRVWHDTQICERPFAECIWDLHQIWEGVRGCTAPAMTEKDASALRTSARAAGLIQDANAKHHPMHKKKLRWWRPSLSAKQARVLRFAAS